MTKILYIPNGQYIIFNAVDETGGITAYYEESYWYATYEDTPEDVILWLCDPANEDDLKEAMGIPVDVELSKKEFEIIP